MKNILSHSFTFQIQTSRAPSGRYENIIHLTDEGNIKHFAQYMQYHENNDKTIDVRHISIKVDRAYFLELANACISDRDRRRHFLSTLGKRRFGASNKHFDPYLSHTDFDIKKLFSLYLSHYESIEFKPCYTETTKYSTNKYRVYIEQYNDSYLVFLDQFNISSRKKIHKIFVIDIQSSDLELYDLLETPVQKVNYIFNKIGKNYFINLPETKLKQSKKYASNEELALSMLITDSKDMEESSRLQDNTPFRKLQDNIRKAGRIDITLFEAANQFIKSPLKDKEKTFALQLQSFNSLLLDNNSFKEISKSLQEVYELAATNTLSYLLSKNDHDLEDIFLYILEAFGVWNQHLHTQNEGIKSFNRASIDLADALHHFIDISYKFKHEYKCNDAEEEIQATPAIEIAEPVVAIPQESFTSAQAYFEEIEIDSEVYEELRELEGEVDVFNYASEYTEDINSALINFFEGYTRILNPLFEFKDLSYSLMVLTQKLVDYEIDENSEILLLLMKGLVRDLFEWKRAVLVDQTAEDIHFMDKSFYTNIAQIEMSLEHTDATIDDEAFGDDDFMEFF